MTNFIFFIEYFFIFNISKKSYNDQVTKYV